MVKTKKKDNVKTETIKMFDEVKALKLEKKETEITMKKVESFLELTSVLHELSVLYEQC